MIGVICLIAVAIPWWSDYRHGKQFASEAGLASGMVLMKSRERVGSVTVLGATSDVVEYSVRYRFRTATGEQIESSASVNRDAWAALDERGPIRVRYLRSDPHVTHVSGQQSSESWTFALAFGVVGFVFTALGATLLFFTLKARA